MNKKAHIFIVSSWLSKKKTEMQGSFVREQAEMLSKKGNKVSVLHGYLKGRFFDNVGKMKVDIFYEDNDLVSICHIGVAPVLPKMKSLGYQRLLKTCTRYFKEYISKHGKPDVIHSHALFMGGVIAFHLSELFLIPFCHTEHASGLVHNKYEYNRHDIKLLREVYSRANKVFFVSSFVRNKISQFYSLDSSNFKVLGNMVSKQFFDAVPNKKKEMFHYVIIGSLIPIKGIELLLHSWIKLILIYPHSRLTIAGDGYLKEELKTLSSALGVTQSVIWKARLTREGVLKEMKNAHVVVSSSRLETFGLTIAEALSVGIPVVVTSSGGVEDFVNQTNGLIVKQDVESYANGLIEVQKNYSRYNTGTIKEQAKARFGEEVIYEKLMAYYLHL